MAMLMFIIGRPSGPSGTAMHPVMPMPTPIGVGAGAGTGIFGGGAGGAGSAK
jgi:hypothetical protein